MCSRNVHGEHNDPQGQHPEPKNWKKTQKPAGTQGAAQSNTEVARLRKPDPKSGKVGMTML